MTDTPAAPTKKPASPRARKPAANKALLPLPAAITEAEAIATAQVAAKAETKRKKRSAKQKVVRDSFTLPQAEYAQIAELKQACLQAGQPVKKSELIRAGLRLLAQLDAAGLAAALGALEKVKTGRPKNN